jgi:tetrapyrrole methylase family protein/MazG family protein/ATP diphosphatase
MTAGDAFEQLVQIMARLRAPGGCPWDREQTHASIKPYTIEEAYEVAEAIEHGDDRELCTELGDLLLQVVFHAEMARARGAFAIADVARAISDKLVRRHPHVFADVEVSGADEVLRNWSRIKAAERQHHEDRSHLAGVPRGMPALLRAQRLGEKAAHVGFDWEHAAGVLAKLREELGELEAAIASGNRDAAEAELGDLLYAATSLARHLGLIAEDALHRAADRFITRFRHMEAQLAAAGRDIHDTTAAEKDQLWEAAKRGLQFPSPSGRACPEPSRGGSG